MGKASNIANGNGTYPSDLPGSRKMSSTKFPTGGSGANSKKMSTRAMKDSTKDNNMTQNSKGAVGKGNKFSKGVPGVAKKRTK